MLFKLALVLAVAEALQPLRSSRQQTRLSAVAGTGRAEKLVIWDVAGRADI